MLPYVFLSFEALIISSIGQHYKNMNGLNQTVKQFIDLYTAINVKSHKMATSKLTRNTNAFFILRLLNITFRQLSENL